VATKSIRTRPDLGRILMIPAAVVVLLLDLMALAGRGGGSMLRWVGPLLTVAFYVLVIWCYLRRGPARATTRPVTARAAAVVATWIPFAISLLHGSPPGAVRQGMSDVLLLAGTAWAVWSLRSLGRNLSVIAQVRDVADGGPYRWVRHPLYAGEIVSTLGLAIAAHSLAAIAVWLVICALQAYRAVREEQLLLVVTTIISRRGVARPLAGRQYSGTAP
jgi:protein-S-isoprenylcysteine O-methyltransferase Ste14